MKIDILTLFPEMFMGPFDSSIIKRAQERKLASITIYNLRDWAEGRHQVVDDRPFGGGVGMVLMIEPIDRALEALKHQVPNTKHKVILLTPQGQQFNQTKALELSKLDRIILIAGHYEGFDERIREHLVDEEISLGDFVLTGGEIPAMAVTDAVIRLLPGVLNKEEATQFESFSGLKIENPEFENLLEYPHYTRPSDYKGWKVPEVLLSGNHAQIEKWRYESSVARTKSRRPDLLKKP